LQRQRQLKSAPGLKLEGMGRLGIVSGRMLDAQTRRPRENRPKEQDISASGWWNSVKCNRRGRTRTRLRWKRRPIPRPNPLKRKSLGTGTKIMRLTRRQRQPDVAAPPNTRPRAANKRAAASRRPATEFLHLFEPLRCDFRKPTIFGVFARPGS
jgi:hypothetical protein